MEVIANKLLIFQVKVFEAKGSSLFLLINKIEINILLWDKSVFGFPKFGTFQQTVFRK